MSNAELARPILDQGIRSVNFFNGRLLSAEDLSREQAASREARRQLGQAIGDGVAYGFEVSRAAGSGTKAIVTIQPGLAINRNGDALQLQARSICHGAAARARGGRKRSGVQRLHAFSVRSLRGRLGRLPLDGLSGAGSRRTRDCKRTAKLGSRMQHQVSGRRRSVSPNPT